MSINREDPTQPYLFKIHGKTYDLKSFKHPGGPIALSLAADRDATQLFESYHPFSPQIQQVLSKYELPASSSEVLGTTKDQDGEALFDWSAKSDFMQELKGRVEPILKQVGTRYANHVRWMQIFAFATLVLLLVKPFVSGEWWSLIPFSFAFWLLAVNVYHDASHMSLHKDWRVNMLGTYVSPNFSSPFTWYHQHVIGHHVYTNIHKKDPDLHHGRMLWRLHPRVKRLSWYKWQAYYVFLIWFIVVPSLAFIIDAAFFVEGSYHRIVKMVKISKRRRQLHYLGRVIVFSLIYVWPYLMPNFSWTKSILFAQVPYLIFSICFSFTSQLNHLTPDNCDQFNKDWYKHQVLTSHSFAPQSLFWFLFTGGLNLQIEHHLFPGINAWHLRKIQPIVQEVCKKHNVHYTVSQTATEAITKYLTHLSNMGSTDHNQLKKLD